MSKVEKKLAEFIFKALNDSDNGRTYVSDYSTERNYSDVCVDGQVNVLDLSRAILDFLEAEW